MRNGEMGKALSMYVERKGRTWEGNKGVGGITFAINLMSSFMQVLKVRRRHMCRSPNHPYYTHTHTHTHT